MGRASEQWALPVLVAGPWQGSHSLNARIRACSWGWRLARVGARPQPANCGALLNQGTGLKATWVGVGKVGR